LWIYRNSFGESGTTALESAKQPWFEIVPPG